MRIVATLAVAALLGWTVGSLRADLAPPKPVVGKPAPFVIEVDEKAKEPRLIVPEDLIPGLRADVGLENEGRRAGIGDLPGRTLVAGLALALAVAFGGLWVVRSRFQPGSRYLAGAVVALVALGAGTALVLANAAPPPPPPRPGQVELPVAFRGKVVLEKHARGNSIRLIVNSDTLKKMTEEKAKPPAAPPKPEE